MKKAFIVIIMAFALVQILSDKVYAIPAFARKYKTSCATCHNGFPKLTAFGETFRRNGYQFPGGTDAEFVKEDPVPLGSDGYKKAFPDAIWPGSLPGTSPISLFLNGEIAYNPKYDPADPSTAARFTFGGLGSSIEAVAAGTLGEDLSFWGHAILNSDGTLELNRMFLIFSNLIGDSYAFNLRVGVIEPSLFSFSTHRAWMEGFWITTRPFSNDMGWSFEETQKGLELNGMLSGRIGYSAGIVEGFGKVHSDKDYYAHLTYKVGGLPLDGVMKEGTALNNAKPYIDNSLTLGAFVYSGSAVLGPDSLLQNNSFTVFGGDVNAYYDRYNLFGGVTIRTDKSPFLESPGQSANTTSLFGELDITVFPWLLPGVRYEIWNGQTIDPASGRVVSYTDSQVVPGIVALIRPNVKLTLRASWAKLASVSTDANENPIFVPGQSLQPGQVLLALTIGI
jgi:hypothetical protein